MRELLSFERKLWADSIRIIAIYLVIVVHLSIVPTQFSLNALPTLTIFAFAKTCVPLFVMLSGALLLGKQETYTVFFQKRLVRLLFPWMTWTLIYTFFYMSMDQVWTLASFFSIYKQTFISFWFILMIVGLYLLTPGIRRFVSQAKMRDMLFVLLLWFFVVSLVPFLRDSLAFPRHVDNSLLRQVISYSGYFLLGYAITLIKPFTYGVGISVFACFVGILWTLSRVLLWDGRIDESQFNYLSPNIVLLSVGFFYLLMLLGTRLQAKFTSGQLFWMQTISSATLGIYFVELLAQQVVMKLYTKYPVTIFPAGINSLLNGLVFFFLSFLVIYFLQKIPYVKRLVA